MENVIVAPRVGQSVFIPFITGNVAKEGENEKIGYIKGGAALPFDTITAVYAETSVTEHGKKIFNVRVKSGDAVSIIQKDDKWQAIR
jgi:hypothetical protein